MKVCGHFHVPTALSPGKESPISIGKRLVGFQIGGEETGLWPFRYSNLYFSVFRPAASHCNVLTAVLLHIDYNKGFQKPIKDWFSDTNDTGGDNVEVSFHKATSTRSNSRILMVTVAKEITGM
jgi:hypothetical protein